MGCPEGWADGVQELDGLLARHLELDSRADQLATANAAAASAAAVAATQ
eukprot:COSAG06_NODE_5294_length_3577_cov_3.642919_4_plen_49_part_00